MKKLNVTATCMTVYNSSIDVPNNMSLEEAIEYAWDNYRMEEYCNGTVGCEDGGYEFDDAELTCCCDVEWTEDGAEIVEENIEEEDEEENDEDED